MKITALARKEAQDILSNKIYIMVVFVQILIILGTFGLALVSSVATDPLLLDQYGITSSLKVGVSEDLRGSELVQDLESQKVSIIYYNGTEQALKLLGTRLVAVVAVDPASQNITVQMDTANVFYPVVSVKISDAVGKFQLEKKLEAAGLGPSEIQKIENPVNLEEIKLNTENQADLALDSSYFVEVMYGFMVPFILLLPFFMASNIVTDSIVGERERKTFEVLLMAPLSSSTVILGKTLPILLFSLVQCGAWVLLLDFLHVPIYNSLLLLFLLFLMGLGFIGLGILISMLVDSTKEANSAITLALVFATFILFVPLFIKINFLEGFLNFIPTVLMVKLASTPRVEPQLYLYIIPTLLVSLSLFFLTLRYFRHERAIRL
jgi:ABC-2 type transport system permease protein